MDHGKMEEKLFVLLSCQLFIACFCQTAIAECARGCTCINPLIVNCSNQNFQQVPRDIATFSIYIDISHNSIYKITSSDFANKYNDVMYLNLSCNEISYIDDGSFANLPQLKLLNLTKNYLTFINVEICFPATQLRELYLAENVFKKMPPFRNLAKLEILDVAHNKFEEVTLNRFTVKLRNLKIIRLSGNNFSRIEDRAFKNLPRTLTVFKCAQCQISYLSENLFRNFTNLEILDLNFNPLSLEQFSNLILSFNQSSNLTMLKLRGVVNKYNLPSHFFDKLASTKLKTLFFSHCSSYGLLKNNTFASLFYLEVLDMRRCELAGVEINAFSGLNNLRKLLLTYNGLSYTSISLSGLFPANLEILYLTGNGLREIKPNDFCDLTKLKELHLKNCQLFKINGLAFPVNNSLEFLDLSYNNIYKLDSISAATFKRLTNLRILYLSGNNLQNILKENVDKRLFRGLSKLTVLSLQNTYINFLTENLFDDLTQLEELNLSGNDFFFCKQFAGSLKNLPRLRLLNLSNNKLTTIHDVCIQYFKKIFKVDLSSNPLTCSSEILSASENENLPETSTSYIDQYRNVCMLQDPFEYSGKKMFEVERNIEKAQSVLPLYAIIIFIFVIPIVSCGCYLWKHKISKHHFRLSAYKPFCVKSYVNLNNQSPYFIYVSYHNDDFDESEQIISKIQELGKIQEDDVRIKEDKAFCRPTLLTACFSKPGNNKAAVNKDHTSAIWTDQASQVSLWYTIEQRNFCPNKSEFKSISDAVEASKLVVIVMSPSYNNCPKKQAELREIFASVLDEKRFIFINTQGESNKSKVPKRFCQNSLFLSWNSNDATMRIACITELSKKLKSAYKMSFNDCEE